MSQYLQNQNQFYHQRKCRFMQAKKSTIINATVSYFASNCSWGPQLRVGILETVTFFPGILSSCVLKLNSASICTAKPISYHVYTVRTYYIFLNWFKSDK